MKLAVASVGEHLVGAVTSPCIMAVCKVRVAIPTEDRGPCRRERGERGNQAGLRKHGKEAHRKRAQRQRPGSWWQGRVKRQGREPGETGLDGEGEGEEAKGTYRSLGFRLFGPQR